MGAARQLVVVVRMEARQLVVPMQSHVVWRQVRSAQLAVWDVAAVDLAACPTWDVVRVHTSRPGQWMRPNRNHERTLRLQRWFRQLDGGLERSQEGLVLQERRKGLPSSCGWMRISIEVAISSSRADLGSENGFCYAGTGVPSSGVQCHSDLDR